MINTKYIIVGQGLAGTALAHTLDCHNIDYIIIDKNPEFSSSKIAAGIANPLVFKRLVKSWNIDLFVPFFNEFYTEIETKLNAKFFSDIDYYKILTNEEELSFWLKKSQGAELSEYIGQIGIPINNKYISKNARVAEVKNTYMLDTATYLEASRQYFISKKRIINEEFNFNSLDLQGINIEYKTKNLTVLSEKIIFCQGAATMGNPYFSWLPFNPAKGEELIVKFDNFDTDIIYTKNIYLIPLGNKTFKVGSNFEWNFENDLPSDKAKNEIINKLKELVIDSFEIIEHKAGVRPATRDRRPFLGTHPKNDRLALFTGTGSKGVMLTPFYSNALFNFLENGLQLDSEVALGRFINFFND